MNIKAIVATLVLGTSSVALAEPYATVERREPVVQVIPATPAPQPYTLHVNTPPVNDMVWHHRLPDWRTLSTSDQLTNGRAFLRIGSPLRTLSLREQTGKTTVSQVKIQFANGATQIAYPRTTLDVNNPSLTIDLSGGLRDVKSITVLGSSGHRGTFEILGAA